VKKSIQEDPEERKSSNNSDDFRVDIPKLEGKLDP